MRSDSGACVAIVAYGLTGAMGRVQATGSQEEKMAFNVEFSDAMKALRADKMALMKDVLRM